MKRNSRELGPPILHLTQFRELLAQVGLLTKENASRLGRIEEKCLILKKSA